MLMLGRARFATAVWMLVICTQSLSFANAAGPVWVKNRGLGCRSCFRPFKALYVLRSFSNCPPICSEPDGTASKPTTRQSFKFDPDERIVLVPVRIGAKEYPFIVDTGCTMSIVDTSFRPYLGRRIDTIEVRDAAGKYITLDSYVAPDAQVGSLPMGEHPVVCFDLTEVRGAVGRDIRGLLGMDFLKDWIIAIDFDVGRVDFLPARTVKQPAWGESIPFTLSDIGAPLIHATLVEGVETSFEVDTGCAGTGDVDEAFLMLLVDWHEARMCGDEKAMTASGMHSSNVARLAHLTVGPFRHDDLRFRGGKGDRLGVGYLSRYRVTIDFPNHQLYLVKGKQYAYRDCGSVSGVWLVFKTHDIEVGDVNEKGPAYAAGVRTKDILVELCGKPVSALTQSEIYRFLGTEGKPVKMAVERGGKRIEMNYTPYEYEEQPSPNGTSAKPSWTQTDSQAGVPAVSRGPCRRFRTRRFTFGRLRCVEEVSGSGCGR